MCALLTIGLMGCTKDGKPEIDSTKEKNDDVSNGWLSEKDRVTSSNSNSIIGTWALHTLVFPGGDLKEVSPNKRDVYTFCSNGRLIVTKFMNDNMPEFPNEDGEYNYSYDIEKQIILLCGKTRKCIISDGEMHIEGYHWAASEPVQEFIFIKKI